MDNTKNDFAPASVKVTVNDYAGGSASVQKINSARGRSVTPSCAALWISASGKLARRSYSEACCCVMPAELSVSHLPGSMAPLAPLIL